MKSLSALVSLVLLLSACAADRGLPLRTAQEVDRVRSANLGEDYLLAPNDEVALAVYGEPELSKTYKIGPDGNIEIPLVGKIPAAGQSVGALEQGGNPERPVHRTNVRCGEFEIHPCRRDVERTVTSPAEHVGAFPRPAERALCDPDHRNAFAQRAVQVTAERRPTALVSVSLPL